MDTDSGNRGSSELCHAVRHEGVEVGRSAGSELGHPMLHLRTSPGELGPVTVTCLQRGALKAFVKA